MRIGTIVNGVVLDHIPAGRGMELYRYLKLDSLEYEVALIKNAPSVKMGRKDILKVSGDIDLNLDVLGYIAPGITVNIIKNSKLIIKTHPKLPDKLVDVIRCNNPRCITSCERELSHVFKLTDAESRTYRCIYCETKAERAKGF